MPTACGFVAFDAAGDELCQRTYYSVGGGFVVSDEVAADGTPEGDRPRHHGAAAAVPQRRGTVAAHREQLSIAQVMRRNERHWRTDAEIDAGLLRIWQVMQDCVARGCRTDGVLPGGFKVKRRAAALYRAPDGEPGGGPARPAAGAGLGQPVRAGGQRRRTPQVAASSRRRPTAPRASCRRCCTTTHRFVPGATPTRGVIDFLLTAAAIGILYKENASISGAEVGCQGEVGVACSMAAGRLGAVMGGTPEQVENAAEIGMEHHLGLTCDPVGGLVQIPCIERNAIASVKAINAARMALRGDGTHFVSLDKVIKTMRETGADMMTKYKETARGGLAVNIVEC
jgi:L-serine dehydratase